MNRNLVGSIYGKFSIKIAHFVPICSQTWPTQAILASDWDELMCSRNVSSSCSTSGTHIKLAQETICATIPPSKQQDRLKLLVKL